MKADNPELGYDDEAHKEQDDEDAQTQSFISPDFHRVNGAVLEAQENLRDYLQNN